MTAITVVVEDHEVVVDVPSPAVTVTVPEHSIVVNVAGPPGPPGSGGGSGGGTDLGWVNVKDHGAIGDGAANDLAAITAAITAAGVGGTVYFPPSPTPYMISGPLVPLDGQTFLGNDDFQYELDETPMIACAIRAAAGFTGSALVHTPTAVRGVVIRKLHFMGLGDSSGSLNGLDLGPPHTGERGWLIDQCRFMYLGGAALAGHMHVLDVRDSHISRCGYGIRPMSGASGGECSLLDGRIIGNQIYGIYHDGIHLNSTGVPPGGIVLMGNRIERCGAAAGPNGIDARSNRDPNACGIRITKGTSIQLVGNNTDANARNGLRIDAAAMGDVLLVTSTGNSWRRDGNGDNAATMNAGVSITRGRMVTMIGDQITFGDPDDGGGGRLSPQYGVEVDSSYFVEWHGIIDNYLWPDGAIRELATYEPNFRCILVDTRAEQSGGGLDQATADGRYVNADGDMMTGDLWITAPPAEDAMVGFLDTATPNNLLRWTVGKTPGAGDFSVARYNTAGGWIDNPLAISGVDGTISAQGGIYAGGEVDADRVVARSGASLYGADLNGQLIGNMGAPVNPTDAANKGYVDANGIPAAIVDAKGDLIIASGPDTVQRLAVGANNFVLIADSAQASGVKWAAVPSDPTKAPVSHSHLIADLPVAASGTSNATQVVRADDSRLSNARTPTTHTHVATTDLTATGTKDNTTFLRGDNTWAVPAGGGGGGLDQATADARYINITGDTMQADLGVSTPSGSSAAIHFQTTGSDRWTMGKTPTAESSGNAGSDFSVARWSDTGAWLDNPLAIARADGGVSVQNTLTVGSTINVDWITARSGGYFSGYPISGVGTPSAATDAATKGYADSKITRVVTSISTSQTAGAAARTDYVYVCTAALTITLPTAVGNSNLYTIKRTGTGTVTINTTSSQTIDGAANASLGTQWLKATYLSNGANWLVVA